MLTLIYSRQERIREAVKEKSVDVRTCGKCVRIDDIISTRSISNAEHVVRDLQDILQSYYKVARKRFVDNVCMQGTEYHIISGSSTPLKLFSPAFVASMSMEQLAEVAGEDAAVVRRRTRLKKEIGDLETGKRILT